MDDQTLECRVEYDLETGRRLKAVSSSHLLNQSGTERRRRPAEIGQAFQEDVADATLTQHEGITSVQIDRPRRKIRPRRRELQQFAPRSFTFERHL